MRRKLPELQNALLLWLVWAVTPSMSVAQVNPPANTPGKLTTTVEVEVLMSPFTSGIAAQQWGEALGKLNVTVSVRQPVFDDELGVSESVRGTLRRVKVVGQLDEQRRLVLPERAFTLDQLAPLQEWLRELQTYGAQGAPEGQRLWGLTSEQFSVLFTALSQAITQECEGQPLESALQGLNLPEAHPLRLSTAAQVHLDSLQPKRPVRQRLSGMSNGTGLALLLTDYGLGFRPTRTPEGSIEFVVQPLAEITDPWPVGWDLQADVTRGQAAPALFRMVPVGFSDLPLEDVLQALSKATAIPIAVDHYGIEQKGVELDQLLVSYPQKRAACMMVINSLVVRSRLKQELRVDELGQPFVYVYAFVPKPLPRSVE